MEAVWWLAKTNFINNLEIVSNVCFDILIYMNTEIALTNMQQLVGKLELSPKKQEEETLDYSALALSGIIGRERHCQAFKILGALGAPTGFPIDLACRKPP